MPISHYINGHAVYEYGPLRYDLTPPVLMAAGFVIRAHVTPGKWCHWHKNPYDPKGKGQIYGGAYDTVEEAIEDARHRMKNPIYQKGQMKLLEVA